MTSAIDISNIELYGFLDLPLFASIDEVKKAYKVQARKLHPDKNPGLRKATLNFQTLQKVYEALTNYDKKANYDQTLFEKQDKAERKRIKKEFKRKRRQELKKKREELKKKRKEEQRLKRELMRKCAKADKQAQDVFANLKNMLRQEQSSRKVELKRKMSEQESKEETPAKKFCEQPVIV